MKARVFCFMVFLWLLVASVVGCVPRQEAPQGEPWILGDKVLIQGCEDLKQRDTGANC